MRGYIGQELNVDRRLTCAWWYLHVLFCDGYRFKFSCNIQWQLQTAGSMIYLPEMCYNLFEMVLSISNSFYPTVGRRRTETILSSCWGTKRMLKAAGSLIHWQPTSGCTSLTDMAPHIFRFKFQCRNLHFQTRRAINASDVRARALSQACHRPWKALSDYCLLCYL